MTHMSQTHGGHKLTPESVAQLRQLDRAVCVICGTLRSRRGHRCSHCRADTATRDLVIGNIFHHRRQPGHQDVTANRPTPHRLLVGTRPVPQGEPMEQSNPEQPKVETWSPLKVNFLALSSSCLSIAHGCFSFRCDAFDIPYQFSGHK